ncbi:MAG: RNA methyltransferase substrate-binding domain-containing protein [Fervidobacterium sp.]
MNNIKKVGNLMIIYGRNVLREIIISKQPVKMVYFSDSHDKELDELIEKVKEKKLNEN